MAFKKVEFATGDTIIKQGDPGDLFYVRTSTHLFTARTHGRIERIERMGTLQPVRPGQSAQMAARHG